MSETKPDPLYAHKPRRICPVCGETTFSREGIHPQCSQKQADAKYDASLKKKKKAADDDPSQASPGDSLKAWQKKCPRCQTPLHVRKTECTCGYEFPRRMTKSAE